MPGDMFGNLWPLLVDLADGAGAPVDYVALGFITVAASLVGGRRRVRPFDTANWTEPCIIWAAAVGDPSANKSPALDASTAPLSTMEADHASLHALTLRSWEAQVARAKAEESAWADDVKAATKEKLATPSKPDAAVIPDEPVRRRLKVVDATPEAMGPILAGNPSGTLHFRDELAGWLQGFERYSPGGREFWLEAYGGRPFVIDRKGAKAPITIPFNGVSVLGGIQPEKLAESLLNGADDGLVARFLWAWPEAIPFRRPQRVADAHRLEQVFRRLDALEWGLSSERGQVAVTLPLDEPAADLFEQWARENDTGLEDASSLFKGFCGKLKGTALRLSLAAEYVAWASDNAEDEPSTISVRTLAAVLDFLDQYAKPTALRVFGDASLPVVERNAATLARHIVRERPRQINASQLRRSARLPGLKDSAAMSDAITLLVEADWLRAAGTREGGGPGRKSSDYLVNPTVLEAANG